VIGDFEIGDLPLPLQVCVLKFAKSQMTQSTIAAMSALDEHKEELERYEFMMGLERGRLAVTMDLLTDALVMVGQHGIYCVSNRNPLQPALDLQSVLKSLNHAKELVGSVMDEIRKKKAALSSSSP
jgi:hypothetical protein